MYPVDLNYQSLDNYTALHFAVADKHNEIVRLLIDNGCNVEAETAFKRRPIHLSCILGNKEGLEILLAYKVEINPTDNNNNTPILLATENCFPNIVELLLSKGADPHIKNVNGYNAVTACPNKEIFEIFKKYNID